MSFILDALKKAEAERNRRVAPVLMDARIAPPRRGLPGWVWALGAVLLVNLALLAWLLLRAPAAQQQATATDATTAPAARPATTEVTPAPTLPTAAPPNPMPAPPAAVPDPMNAARIAAPQLPPNADDANLPTLAELQAAGVSLPQLELNLHVYDLAPASRWALLNGQRLREGDYSPQGVKVERITTQGVVLEAAGRRFRLNAGD